MEKHITIAEARVKNNLPIEQVSSYLNVSADTLRTYEKHPQDTPIRDAVLLSEIFGISINKFNFR